MNPVQKPNKERKEYYDKISGQSLAPLWEVLGDIVTKEPVTTASAHLWKYDEIRPHIMEAGALISAKEAERRVLVLENPELRGQSRITPSLYAGMQLILPGEVAPAHRHMASALRFIIEGDGAYTAVNGEKTLMKEGDFVITPPWAWHDHGNDSEKPMVWMDGLDIHLVNMFEAGFADNYPEDSQPLGRDVNYSHDNFAHNLLPVGYDNAKNYSPIFNYPYERTRESLERMRKYEEWDSCHGLKVQYVNPTNGDFAMPTIGTFMQLLPKDFKTTPYKSTDGTIYSAVEGHGRTIVGGKTLEWDPKDVFVIPSWLPHHHEVDDDAVLFSFSDRPAQKKLGFWREQRGNDPVSAPQ